MKNNKLNNILINLKNGDTSLLVTENIKLINDIVLDILNKKDHSQKDIMNMGIIIKISNLLYNNTDRNMLPLEDGVYDIFLELYKKYNPMYQVGSIPISIGNKTTNELLNDNNIINPFKRINNIKINKFLFKKELLKQPNYNRNDLLIHPFKRNNNEYISKRLVNTKHKYPELVGTLDKCKFVLNSQALNKGVFNDSNVKIVERDFFAKHIFENIINPNDNIRMVLELKYDGISVEAEVNNQVISARTRGDANQDIAADITPILGGYKFHQAKDIPDDNIFGMKFEAVMSYKNLNRYNNMKGKNYKNCRTAISSIFASSDAFKYRDLITLVPLATSLNLNRIIELEFMNTFYRTDECLRYAIIEGDYTTLLYQIKKFVDESEYMRSYMPFMYDGVVISYINENIRKKLGRQNSVNKYSMAIKYNPLNKLSIFRGYTFTVGQNGVITPMIHYDPVEFYGTIHTKSSGHSYENFNKLKLRKGDILSIEYVNDVMPYVTKPNNSSNANNNNPLETFITDCPFCNAKLKISDSGKSIICGNIECPGRNIKRISSMMKKLNLKDFSESYLLKISKFSLSELLNLTINDVKFLGDILAHKFIDRMNEIKTKPIYDYQIIGSLGFSDIGRRKWKLILNKISLNEILSIDKNTFKNTLNNIKGIGPTTIDVILKEFDFFKKDLITINNMNNIINIKGEKIGKTIKITGFRNSQLIQHLIEMGHDIGEGSVTKNTDILLVPYDNFTSTKTKKATEYNIQIISVDNFINNLNKYLN